MLHPSADITYAAIRLDALAKKLDENLLMQWKKT